MNEQEHINYERIANAIAYIKTNFKQQPSLEEVAEKINISPFHFQKLFTDWAGVSPKKFLQYISLQHAKSILKNKHTNLFETAIDIGLSSTGRLHDLFIKIEGMTPAEYKNEGENLLINYSYADSKFGKIIVASTQKGICYLAFMDDENLALNDLQNHFSKAKFNQATDAFHQNAIKVFDMDWNHINEIKLHLRGTDFQLKVWEALLKIPMGKLNTYGSIAETIQSPKASRAVGTAIGSNPVAFLIPCHRVIQSSGALGGYMWGITRKTVMIGWEQANTMQKDV